MKISRNQISFYILITGLLIALTFFVFNSYRDIVDSEAFSAFATLFVGGIAIFLYLKEKSDKKAQAARVLLLEIRSAEEKITQIKDLIKEGDTEEDLPNIFPTKSWKKFSNLFVSDFDTDELKLINDFYEYGELVEEFAKRNNDFFWVTTEERARLVQQKMAKLNLEEYRTNGIKNLKEHSFLTIRDAVLDEISNARYDYRPNKTLKRIAIYIEKINNITTSSAGAKLKTIAKM